jgi:hypothetical protein
MVCTLGPASSNDEKGSGFWGVMGGLTRNSIGYIAMAMWIRRNGIKSLLWVAILGLAVVWCDLDHARPITDFSGHGHSASSVCHFELCISLTSFNDTSPLVKARGSFLWLFCLAAAMGFNRRLILEVRASRPLVFRIDHLPQPTTKLYQLHSAYLI